MEQTHTYKYYARAGKILLISFGVIALFLFSLYKITNWDESPAYFVVFIVAAIFVIPVFIPLFFRWMFRRPLLVIDQEGIVDKTNSANSRHKITWDEIESFDTRLISGIENNLSMRKIILNIEDMPAYIKKRGARAKFVELLHQIVTQGSSQQGNYQGSVYIRSDLLNTKELEVTNAIIDASNGKVRRRDVVQR